MKHILIILAAILAIIGLFIFITRQDTGLYYPADAVIGVSNSSHLGGLQQ